MGVVETVVACDCAKLYMTRLQMFIIEIYFLQSEAEAIYTFVLKTKNRYHEVLFSILKIVCTFNYIGRKEINYCKIKGKNSN